MVIVPLHQQKWIAEISIWIPSKPGKNCTIRQSTVQAPYQLLGTVMLFFPWQKASMPFLIWIHAFLAHRYRSTHIRCAHGKLNWNLSSKDQNLSFSLFDSPQDSVPSLLSQDRAVFWNEKEKTAPLNVFMQILRCKTESQHKPISLSFFILAAWNSE